MKICKKTRLFQITKSQRLSNKARRHLQKEGDLKLARLCQQKNQIIQIVTTVYQARMPSQKKKLRSPIPADLLFNQVSHKEEANSPVSIADRPRTGLMLDRKRLLSQIEADRTQEKSQKASSTIQKGHTATQTKTKSG